MMTKPTQAGLAAGLACFALANTARAGRTVPEIKAFIKKQNACVFAFAGVVKSSIEASTGQPCMDKEGQLFQTCAGRAQVVCIFDSVLGAGTIDEQRGCSIAWYDFAENAYVTFKDAEIFIPLECTKAVVNRILTHPASDWGATGSVRAIPFSPKAPPLDVTAQGLYQAALNATDPSKLSVDILADRFNIKRSLPKPH